MLQDINIDFSIKTQWQQGFTGRLDLLNTGDKIKDWTIEFKSAFKIESGMIWGAKVVSHQGDRYVLKPVDYNEVIDSQKTISIFFNANKVNGKIVPPNNYVFNEKSLNAPVSGVSNNNSIPEDNDDIEFKFKVDKEWEQGFTGKLDLLNTGDKIKDWTIEFKSAFKIEPGMIWGAKVVSHQGDRYVLKPVDYNEVIDSQKTISIFFNANKVNGKIVPPNNYIFNEKSLNAPKGESQPQPQPEPNPIVENPVDVDSDGNLPNSDSDNSSQDIIKDNGITNPQPGRGQFRYGEALQKSFLFFEANRSGVLPKDNRIEWRGNSATNDGRDVGRDLTGGYYDAGDHVKFGLPMAANNTMLAWGGIEYEQAYKKAGQWDELLEAVKWGTDYFLKAHVTEGGKTKELYVQVGDGDADHKYWGSPEKMTMARPAFKIDASKPGSDVAAQTASALASASILFRSTNKAYADKLLKNAKQLFEFAETYQAKYSDSVPQANPFYTSFSGYWDELTEAAAWLNKATGEQQYLDKAESFFNNHIGGLGDWTWVADDKSYSAAVLLAQQSDDSRYKNEVEKWINRWVNGEGAIQYSSGGLAFRTRWGSLALSSSASYLTELYNDTVKQDSRYGKFATSQIDYILGDNPRNASYMIGFGENYPQQPHHRAASGDAPYGQPNEHIIFGALVGGPGSTNDFDYNDDRNDWITNEVGTGYNAPLTSALIQQYDNFGGDPLSESELDTLVGIDANGVGF